LRHAADDLQAEDLRGGVLVGAGHQHEALVGQAAGAVEQRLIEPDGETRCHVGVEQRVLLRGALAERAK
jgi:hypothetical protein